MKTGTDKTTKKLMINEPIVVQSLSRAIRRVKRVRI